MSPSQSTIQVLKFRSFDMGPDAVGGLYIQAVSERLIDFNDDVQTCAADTIISTWCFAAAQLESCSVTNQVASNISNSPVIITFTGIVGASDTAGCCNSNSCVGVYLDTESADLEKGDIILYSYK